MQYTARKSAGLGNSAISLFGEGQPLSNPIAANVATIVRHERIPMGQLASITA